MKIITSSEELIKKIPEQAQYCYFIAETQEEIFQLGEMSKMLPFSSRGIGLDGKISLGVRIIDVVNKLTKNEVVVSED